MSEIILELSLNRSSGVLASIVASLAQAGIELKSQKLQRADEGRGGWLTIVGAGDSPEPSGLAERLNGTRGVERLMRVIVDGEAILAEGKPLEDQIQPDDLAELSAGSDADSDQGNEMPETSSADRADEAHAGGPHVEEDSVEQDLAAALGTDGERVAEDQPAPEFTGEPTAEGDLADALQDQDEPTEPAEPSGTGLDEDDSGHVIKVLRRRRRRRR